MNGRRLLLTLVAAAAGAAALAAAAWAASGQPGPPPTAPASPNTRCNFGDPSWYGFASKQQCHAFFDAGGSIWSLQEDLRRSSTNPAPDSYRVGGVWAFRSKSATDALPGALLGHLTTFGDGNKQWDTITQGVGNNVPLVGVAGPGGSLAAAHPGYPGLSPTEAIVDWKARTTDRYEVRLDLWIGDPVCNQTFDSDGIGWRLVAATAGSETQLGSGVLDPDSAAHELRSISVDLKAEDHLYLVITPGPDDNINCDTLAMHFTVLDPGS